MLMKTKVMTISLCLADGGVARCMANTNQSGDVYIGEDTVVDPFASVCGPTIVGKNCVVRTGARIRGNCIFGDRVVVGGEIKSSILMDEASFPHQSYVGDSICVPIGILRTCHITLIPTTSTQGFRSHFGNGATRCGSTSSDLKPLGV